MEIAVPGIDGSGKSTFVQTTVDLLKAHGIDAAHIDVPYFTQVPGFGKISSHISRMWLWADMRKNRVVMIPLGVLAAFLYVLARRRLRRTDLLFVEHHPSIDVPAYASSYGGSFGLLLAKTVIWLWPKPDAVFMITISTASAYTRILERGKQVQMHETPTDLDELQVRLKRLVSSVSTQHWFVENPTAEGFVNSCLPTLRATTRGNAQK